MVSSLARAPHLLVMRLLLVALLFAHADALLPGPGQLPGPGHSPRKDERDALHSRSRWLLPQGDARDKRISDMLWPSVASLMVVPLTGAVDTFWVGRMGDTLALAGQGAANQLFGAVFFMLTFVATATVPLVAQAYASGDVETARDRTCDSLFLSTLVGLLCMVLLVGFPRFSLQLVLQPDSLAMPYAAQYLRLRSLSIIPALFAGTGFAAFRGCLDVVTPLRVSIASNLINLVLDPVLIFGGPLGAGLGVAGAAIATTLSEVFAGAAYCGLLLRKRLLSLSRLRTLPSAASLAPLLRVSSAMLFRAGMWNVIMLLRARSAQSMDSTGVAAAAYAISLQIYYVGVVFSTAMQSTAAALVAAARARSPEAARAEAARVLAWSVVTGAAVMALQLLALPRLIPLFTTVPAVQSALPAPLRVCALLQLVNCVSYTSEGVCMAVGAWGTLVRVLAVSFGLFLLAVDWSARAGLGLAGVWASLGVLNVCTALGCLGCLYRPNGVIARADLKAPGPARPPAAGA